MRSAAAATVWAVSKARCASLHTMRADRLAGQQLGGARGLLQAEHAQRLVDGLEDALRVASVWPWRRK